MILYNKNNVFVRTIEEKDKGSYLNLYAKEKSLYDILYPDAKPTIYQEEQIISKIINKEIISEEILVITEKDKVIGYSVVARTEEKRYDICQFVIEKEQRSKQYDKILLDVIKMCAEKDKCDIYVKCPDYEYYNRYFYVNAGNFKPFSNDGCFYKNLEKSTDTSNKMKFSIFPDYDLIKKEKEQNYQEKIKSYQNFLQSDIGKMIMNIH